MLCVSISYCYAECHAECRNFFVMLSFIMMSFIMVSVITLSFIMLSAIMLTVIMLILIMLSFIMINFIIVCVSQYLTVMLSFHYADCCYAACHNFFLLCWVSLCWMLLCWVLWRRSKPLVEWRENKILKTIFGLSWKQFTHRGTKNRLG
jgi:hypothetical protein